jgi:hypothetical protein
VAWQSKVVKVASRTDPSKAYEVTADFSEQRGHDNNFECTCPAYQYQGMAESGAKCKHILEVEDQFCDWHSESSDDAQTEEQEREHVCPRCGGRTETAMMGV